MKNSDRSNQKKQSNPLLHILIIEDVPDDVSRIRLMLSEPGEWKFKLASAKDVEEGIRYLNDEPFDLVFLSFSLKNKEWLDRLSDIRHSAPSIPVVVLTGQEDPELAGKVLKLGAQDFLLKKDLTPQILPRVIKHAIERHEVFADLRNKNEELERLNSLKTEFISTVSHELRTPLAIIISALNNFLNGNLGQVSPDQKKWLVKIRGHSGRLQEMITDLLDLSRLQTGRTTFRRTQVDFGGYAKGILGNMNILAEEKKINLTHKIGENLPLVWMDPGRLEQVITNLITNAFKFVHGSGHIHVSVEKKESFVIFKVSDDGPGIPKDQLEKIFERFHQIRTHDNKQTSIKGLGLGLAICKEIVIRHKGQLWAESEVGKGSSFIFKIPCDPRTRILPLKILVVDDDEEICDLLKSTLEKGNHEVCVVKNGINALKMIAQKAFDLAFVDLMIPAPDGLEIIKKLKRLNKPPAIAVVTAYPKSEILYKAMEFGAVTLIPKPFRPEIILEFVERLANPDEAVDSNAPLNRQASEG